MKYYKILKDGEFVGVVSSANFVRNQRKYNYLETVNEVLGQFIDFNGTLYRTPWMQPLPAIAYNYEMAQVIEISQEVYESFKAAIENNEEIITPPEQINIVPIEEPIDTISIDYAKQLKLTELNHICTNTIESGVDIEDKHYSMAVTDQLNLLAAENTIAAGMETAIYHADGEDYRYFTAEEIYAIISAATQWRVYNTTYYKAAQAYINSLTDVELILGFTYGDPVPEKFKSDILKQIEQE